MKDINEPQQEMQGQHQPRPGVEVVCSETCVRLVQVEHLLELVQLETR